MFNQSKVLLYGGYVPALKHTSTDKTDIILGAGLTLTELGTCLNALETHLEGQQ